MKINPCPFCRHVDVEWCEPEPGRYAIDCPQCQCIGPFGDTEAIAAEKWNAAGAQDRRRCSVLTELCQEHEREIERLRGAGSENLPAPHGVGCNGGFGVGYWIEIHCDAGRRGCLSHQNIGPMAHAKGSVASLSKVRKILGNEAVLAGWKKVGSRWICPKCKAPPNVEVRGPEAALSPEAPSRLTGSTAGEGD